MSLCKHSSKKHDILRKNLSRYAFCANEPILANAPHEAWAFGCEPDFLAKLVLRGQKTATTSSYPLYALENEPLPQVGEYNIILDGNDEAICITKTTKVYRTLFKNVSARHAYSSLPN